MFALPTLSLQEEILPPRQEKTTAYRRETFTLPEVEEEKEKVIFPKVPKRKKVVSPPLPTPPLENKRYRGKAVNKVRYQEIAKTLPKLPKVEREKQGVTLSFPALGSSGLMLPKVREM